MVGGLTLVAGRALELDVPDDKIKGLINVIGRELKQEDIGPAWIYYTSADESCYKTASALERGFLESGKVLPCIVEQDFLYAGRLEETDKWTKRMIDHPNSFVLVAQQQFTDIYPTHFWQRILKRKGGVAPLKEGEAVSFTVNHKGEYSCAIL